MQGITIIGASVASHTAASILRDKRVSKVVASSINDLKSRLATEAYTPYVIDAPQLSNTNIKCGKELRRERRKKMRK